MIRSHWFFAVATVSASTAAHANWPQHQVAGLLPNNISPATYERHKTLPFDLDGDGEDELVVSSRAGVHVLEVSVDGLVSIQELGPPGSNFPVVVDLNLDGWLDVVFSDGTDVVIAIGSAVGFSAPVRLWSPTSPAESLAACDMNGDGFLDLVAGWEDNDLVWLEQNGFGAYVAEWPIELGIDRGSVPYLEAFDIDQDGDCDAIQSQITSSFDQDLLLHANDGAGGFGAAQSLAECAAEIWLEDADNDGDVDIHCTTYPSFPNNGGVSRGYENVGGGTMVLDWTGTGCAAKGITLIDFYGGGFFQPVWGCANPIWENFHPILWAPYRTDWGISGVSGDYESHGGYSVFSRSDIDGDGDGDLLMADKVLSWRSNEGAAGLGSERIIASTVGLALDVADINGDGNIDVLWSQNRIAAWSDATPAPLLERSSTMSTFHTFQDIKAADIDGDGDLDLIGSGEHPNGTYWYENTGAGFGPPNTITTSLLDQLAVADFNLDGTMDVVILGNVYDQINWYTNDGAGNFTYEGEISNGYSEAPDRVEAVDVDGDGDADLIVRSFADTKTVWFENQGGVWGPQRIIATTKVWVITADLNLDGTPDLIEADDANSRVRLRVGLGGGLFGPPVDVLTGVNCVELAIFDPDSDGDSDFACIGSLVSDLVLKQALGNAS